MQERKEILIGTWFGIGAFVAWGLLPIFWKTVDHVPDLEVLAHRVVWSFVFVLMILLVLGKGKSFLSEGKAILAKKKVLLGVLLASILISLNWFIYIYAVNSGQIVETSLGYYINPLLSVLLGILVLKEKLSFWQMISFTLALIGVLILTFGYGSFPWIAFLLAITFALYGLAKKLTNLGAMTGLTIETLMMTPVALVFVVWLQVGGSGSFTTLGGWTTFFLMASGAVTAIPLLLFASGARRIPLSLIGFLQYIAPTLQLLIGVFIYQESFTKTHLIAFSFIWTALIIFSVANTSWMKKLEPAKAYQRRKNRTLN
ncbi:EamA family transporter RarD [Bacillus horti]|uniref:Chloramphenicol-sensitive protein RarD n=1 Tax=Caldalkalibacillus horti TaxID=77523 RepID=A0ABT9W327_9BACI|nr:EamA family transporter RarD [Bacillus horti]MDQ0167647.1 chloramphenicol-sensitive protein RarD [Bacillus horti]